jgi:hypothetical protein
LQFRKFQDCNVAALDYALWNRSLHKGVISTGIESLPNLMRSFTFLTAYICTQAQTEIMLQAYLLYGTGKTGQK